MNSPPPPVPPDEPGLPQQGQRFWTFFWVCLLITAVSLVVALAFAAIAIKGIMAHAN